MATALRHDLAADQDLAAKMRELGERALAAARILAATPRALKDQALCAAAESLRDRQNELLAANARDMAAAHERGLRASLLDRLALDAVRVEAMAAGLEAVAELIRISREAKIPAEIYHLKAAGKANWSKMDTVIAMIEKARASGLKITADMYTYTAGATGLDAAMPPWVLDGGYEAAFKRLKDPATRQKIAHAIVTPSKDWENLFLAAGSPDRILLVEFKSEALKPLTGKTLAAVAKERGESVTDTIMNLVLEDRSRVGTVYFMMSEDNVRKEIALPWVSFGSDAASMAPEPPFTRSSAHPRAYGNFARLLGRYVRDEKLIPLEEAVYRLSGLPATNLALAGRGILREGMFADVVVFDPAQIADRATFDQPHQYAVGMTHVFVNGVQVLKDGEHTGAKPGRALWGAGRK